MAIAKTKTKEKTPLVRSKDSFTLIGEVKVNDKTFPKESRSKNGFIGRRINLGVQISEGYVVYCEAFGGYQEDAPRELNAYISSSEKNEDGSYKKGKLSKVAWEDRLSLDSKFEDSIADFSMFVVSLEKDDKGHAFKRRFLSVYDAQDYVAEHLTDGMRVMVKGNLKPNLYNGIVTFKKEISAIYLYTGKEENSAKGRISVYVDKNSIGKNRIKTDGELDVNGAFVGYSSKHKADVPFPIELILPLGINGDEKVQKLAEFTAKEIACKDKQVIKIGFDVIFQEGSMTKEATLDDLDDYARDLVDKGYMSLEDVVGKTVVKGGRLNRIIIERPSFNNETGKEAGAKLKLVLDADKTTWTIDDIEYPVDEEDKVEEVVEATIEDIDALISSTTSGGSDWLTELAGSL